MRQGFFVTGTDTGVGKTEITAAIAAHYADNGITVHPRKPVESGCLVDTKGEKLFPQDASTLQTASRTIESLSEICPYRFTQPVSPERAAAISGNRLTLEMLKDACRPGAEWGASDLLLIEGAGGFYSPIAEHALNADLATAVGLPLILVAEDRLGAVNQVLMARHAILDRGLDIKYIFLNKQRYSDENNLESISELVPEPVIPIPVEESLQPWKLIQHIMSDYLLMNR
ncbi:MAG: dethiobiotin synthase [Gammaproteobacteria bacterium]|uniref:ATP-dependent dethiobiotin synthetase BioD n=1 Tax=Candidatus Thiopontia autotrophica TaxID=2841688 RepID=A0A8J6P3P3_9GAMM|nr:dethiobiotin synthase [Candidatus Thiopontia autotrophica]MBL6969437.1 dethiobiotin synthase [Gammaproteobacteria bacterium]